MTALISEVILLANDACVVFEAFMSKKVQQELRESNLSTAILDELAVMTYLFNHCRNGDPHVSPFDQLGIEHRQLIENILDKLFKDDQDSFQTAGPRYFLLNTLLKEIQSVKQKQPMNVDQPQTST